jgi:hypothetical protein
MRCTLLRSFCSLKTGYFISSCNQMGVLYGQKIPMCVTAVSVPNNHK